MSPAVVHEEARRQTPPWQLVEQHWLPVVQASPSVLQLVGRAVQAPPVHRPEQHSPGSPQASPTCLHSWRPQAPLLLADQAVAVHPSP